MTNASRLALGLRGFLDAVLDKRLSYTDQRVLADTVASAVKRDLPGKRRRLRVAVAARRLDLSTGRRDPRLWRLLQFSAPPKVIPPPLIDIKSKR